MSELKIKFIFKGPNQNIKKPEIINGVLCISLKQSREFLFARNNKPIFEFIVNSQTDKEKIKIIKLLENPKFYEFVREIPNIENYSRYIEKHTKIENYKSTAELVSNFEKWVIGKDKTKKQAIAEIGKITKEEILKNYFNILRSPEYNKNYKKPVVKRKAKRTITRLK